MRVSQRSYDHKFARVGRRLRDYPRGRTSGVGDWDPLADVTSSGSSDLYLGVYGDKAIMDLLAAYDVLDALSAQGISRPLLDLDLSDPFRHILRLYQQVKGPQSLVVEVVFRYTDFLPNNEAAEPVRYPCLQLEWLLLQNPARQFDGKHRPLPGQDHPPLALGNMVMSLMARLGRYLGVDGIITMPANLHSALFLAKRFQPVSTQVQAELQALAKTARRVGRFQIVWAEHWGDLLVRDAKKVYRWTPATMVFPMSTRLKSALDALDDHKADKTRSAPGFVIRSGVKARPLPDGQVARDPGTG